MFHRSLECTKGCLRRHAFDDDDDYDYYYLLYDEVGLNLWIFC